MEVPTTQAYVGLRDPSSASAPEAEQVNVLPVTTPLAGDITAVVMVGAVFSTVTLVEALADVPTESVTVAVQVILSPTSMSEASTE